MLPDPLVAWTQTYHRQHEYKSHLSIKQPAEHNDSSLSDNTKPDITISRLLHARSRPANPVKRKIGGFWGPKIGRNSKHFLRRKMIYIWRVLAYFGLLYPPVLQWEHCNKLKLLNATNKIEKNWPSSFTGMTNHCRLLDDQMTINNAQQLDKICAMICPHTWCPAHCLLQPLLQLS